MGIHSEHESGRKFTELQGWTNQRIAAMADKAILMVFWTSISIKIKTHYVTY